MIVMICYFILWLAARLFGAQWIREQRRRCVELTVEFYQIRINVLTFLISYHESRGYEACTISGRILNSDWSENVEQHSFIINIFK